MDFKDRRVIVTGGTKGLGKAIALSFAREGAWVAVNYFHDDEAAIGAMEELKALSPKTIMLKGDVSSKRDIEEMFAKCLNQWQHIDILVNNAGIIRDKMLMFLNEDDWDRVVEVNLKGTYLCTRAVIRSMIGRRCGRVINIASPSGITGRSGQTNYSASKGGIISFTKSLSREVARFGITVNAVCPGVISSGMTDKLNEDVKAEFLGMIPMERFGEAQEVADAVMFLASMKGGYITGQVLVVDGGLT